MSFGKDRRMNRLVGSSGPAFILPLDDGLISGPRMSLIDPRDLVRSAVDSGASSVLGYPGLLRRCHPDLGDAGYIQNLTCSTILSRHTQKTLLYGVEDAIRNSADGVAVHVNLSSDAEPEMLANLGSVSEECRQLDLPLFVLSYPRREGAMGDDNYDSLRSGSMDEYAALVAHCARVAVEVGADIVKVPYTGSTDSFSTVIEAALGVPVFVSGGVPVESEDAIAVAVNAVRAGAAGVAYGRQSFMRSAADAGRFVTDVLTAMKAERSTAAELTISG